MQAMLDYKLMYEEKINFNSAVPFVILFKLKA